MELAYCSSGGWCGADLLFLWWMVWSWLIVPLVDGVELTYCSSFDGVELDYFSSVGWCEAGLLFLF